MHKVKWNKTDQTIPHNIVIHTSNEKKNTILIGRLKIDFSIEKITIINIYIKKR